MQSLVLLLALVVAASAVATFHKADDNRRVDGSYIIVFKKGVEQNLLVSYMTEVVKNNIDLETFQIRDMQGAFVKMTPYQAQEQLNHDNVIEYIEEDQIQSIGACTTQSDADWNLERLSERTIDLGNLQGFNHDSTQGAGVTSYIIDTGVHYTHNDFGGRASWGTNTVDSTNSDCNGHGTHVAGTVAGTVHGVAKKTTIVAVKVLNCQGSGTTQSVIAGIEWVAQNAKKPANANMSLGGGNSLAIIDAVEAAIQSGIPFIVAAGNSNANACNYSPANAPNAITVGSTAIEAQSGSEIQEDIRSSFSNYGQCVDIFAPGSLIRGPWIGSNTATRTISGTSMASPHVAGVVSLIQAVNPNISPVEILKELVDNATADQIDLACTNTACLNSPNLLAYTNYCS
eukprot:TRINITY_DN227_c1_g1_i3.p1 TRINITY_DN227_c1_g1~~TRINITY_DN227_c1_g1_i3.p1  ORF type:complete len:400 (-),score=85.39 TRINITY_DN227_c1_g1_i3:144-1343(-)